MSPSHYCSAAAGFLLASLLSILLPILFGAGGLTMSIWLHACFIVAGALVAGAAYTSTKEPSRRKRVRPTRIMPEHLSEHMRRDLGLDNL